MLKTFLVVLLFLVHQASSAQPDSLTPPLKKIKILSWNIYMLPYLVASHSGKKERAEAIGQTLASSDFDVIFFQEAFHATARKKILHQLQDKFPFHSGPANKKWWSLKTNSGLLVFSRYPIVYSKAIVYKNRYGVDALSRKGALLVELEVQGQRIQVAGTHLQNSGPPRWRQAQCEEFYQHLLKPNAQEGVPQLICGDFNINRLAALEDYYFMLQALDAKDSNQESNEYSYDRAANDLHIEKGSGKDLIDYVLFRSNGGVAFCTNRVTALRKQWCAHHADLSDHYALQAEIVFSNMPPSTVASLK